MGRRWERKEKGVNRQGCKTGVRGGCTHETSTLTFCVQIYHQMLEDVHVCSVGDGAGGWRAALAVDVGNGLCAHVQHQCIHQRHVVLHARLI